MKKIISIIVVIFTILPIVVVTYGKSHMIRECTVTQNCDKCVTVLHPNGEYYDFYAVNNQEFKVDTIIKVSFNELKFNKENFTVNFATPIPVQNLKPIETRVQNLKPIETRVQNLKPIETRVQNLKPIETRVQNLK